MSKLWKWWWDWIFYIIPWITTILAYISYKWATSRLLGNKTRYIKELLPLVLLSLIYAWFFRFSNTETIVSNPVSVLPLIIYFWIYIKINFINKNRKKDEVVKIVFSWLVLILWLVLIYSFNEKQKTNNNETHNEFKNVNIIFDKEKWEYIDTFDNDRVIYDKDTYTLFKKCEFIVWKWRLEENMKCQNDLKNKGSK
jgi:hypothetical protein